VPAQPPIYDIIITVRIFLEIKLAKEVGMRISVDITRKNTVQLRVAALVLLAVALVIPQLSWADHASDHPYSQFDDPAPVSPSYGYAALVEKYKTGELVFHTPGRRDDRSFSSSPSEAYAALVEKYKTGELVFNAPGRRDDRSFSASADSARWVAQGKYYMEESERAESAAAARWVALGEYYTDDTGRDAAFLAANPEIMVYMRFVQDGCSEPGQVC
jgi:hypothetical protein